ncbi:MAG: hypothetical protein K2O96_02805, partial [Lachnospiraceae bacterium]|nr:hypothetical protein [Lachnospiraceae bacterium]
AAIEAVQSVTEDKSVENVEAKKALPASSIKIATATSGTDSEIKSLASKSAGEIYFDGTSVKGNRWGWSRTVSFSKKGTLVLAAQRVYGNKSVSFGIYKDANMTQRVDLDLYLSDSSIKTRVIKIPKAGKYYMGAYAAANPEADVHAIATSALFVSGGDRTITNNKQIAVGQKDKQINYFKFKATATGYVTCYASDKYIKVALCNSSKKALSGYTNAGYNPTYGVVKGKWYYFKVYSRYNSEGSYTFKVKHGKIAEKSGRTKAKASTLGRNSTRKATITAGSGQADWYKLKLTSKRTFKLYFNGRTNDRLKIEIYQGKKKYTRTFYNTHKSLTLSFSGSWPKGTYYIKVSRGNSKSSGWYSLKWK